MTEKQGHRHLGDLLFHGLKPIYIMLFATYLINQYSQLVMVSRKAEMETLGSSVQGRAKSAIVGANTDLAEATASSE